MQRGDESSRRSKQQEEEAVAAGSAAFEFGKEDVLRPETESRLAQRRPRARTLTTSHQRGVTRLDRRAGARQEVTPRRGEGNSGNEACAVRLIPGLRSRAGRFTPASLSPCGLGGGGGDGGANEERVQALAQVYGV